MDTKPPITDSYKKSRDLCKAPGVGDLCTANITLDGLLQGMDPVFSVDTRWKYKGVLRCSPIFSGVWRLLVGNLGLQAPGQVL